MSNKVMVASEVLTTGWCPLNCSYCYIPKTEHMKEVHKQIVETLKSGQFVKDLYQTYGDNLEYLGFWGTEPVLTLPELGERMKEIVETFPKLKEINFSTNMMMDPKVIVCFIDILRKLDRELLLKIQVSLDGPAWITDVNRQKGAAEKIPKNLFWIVGQLNRGNLRKLKVQFRWKPTHSIDNYRRFVTEPHLSGEYKEFFEGINSQFKKLNENESVSLRVGYTPTIVCPGKYTSEDGRLFAEYVRLMHEQDMHTSYTWRLLRFIDHSEDLSKRRQFSCSGGDGNFGFDGEVHMCHRTFYYNNPGYVDSVMSDIDIDNWDVSLFERGTLEHIRKWFIVDPKNELVLNRFLFVMRGYHDYWRHQISYLHGMMIELALAGQVDPRYATDEKLRDLFALFQCIGMSCPMENLLNTGSIHLQVVSLLRLFGNGAFQEIVRQTEKVMGERTDKKEELGGKDCG